MCTKSRKLIDTFDLVVKFDETASKFKSTYQILQQIQSAVEGKAGIIIILTAQLAILSVSDLFRFPTKWSWQLLLKYYHHIVKKHWEFDCRLRNTFVSWPSFHRSVGDRPTCVLQPFTCNGVTLSSTLPKNRALLRLEFWRTALTAKGSEVKERFISLDEAQIMPPTNFTLKASIRPSLTNLQPTIILDRKLAYAEQGTR